jgi:hypothetical protein
MFLFVMFLVYFEYAFDMVIVIFKFMHRIIERLTQYSSGLSIQILCKRGAFLHVDVPYILKRVVDREGDSLVDPLQSTSHL